MNLRTAMSSWAGAGAAENARCSLEEWTRAQEEVTALLARLEREGRPHPAAAVDGGAQARSA
ncbi:MAG TPA: hypothetical protein VFI47_06290 [Acidimicrobiales bacterium]|nr:hypothetical protein [Acidimicrobiales bacterium]